MVLQVRLISRGYAKLELQNNACFANRSSYPLRALEMVDSRYLPTLVQSLTVQKCLGGIDEMFL